MRGGGGGGGVELVDEPLRCLTGLSVVATDESRRICDI